MKPRRLSKKGFTIVELLVVIVVIAILAAITVVAYNGIQVKARDSQRKQDVKTIAKALELYYIDNGQYPTISCASNCSINGSWGTSSDVGWDGLASKLIPKYISSLPKDPSNTTGSVLSESPNYSYALYTGAYCGAGTRQMYLLAYKLEAGTQEYTRIGDCPTSPLTYDPPSYYRVVK
jgi:general secretion pathway protein G